MRLEKVLSDGELVEPESKDVSTDHLERVYYIVEGDGEGIIIQNVLI